MSATQLQSTISPAELSRRLAASGRLDVLDVRTPGEYATGHVPGAVLLPLDDLDAVAYLRNRQPGAGPIYLLCQSGGRACKAAARLRAAGATECVVIEGGTQAWLDAGLPVDRAPRHVLPLVQQVQLIVGSLSALGALLALTVNVWFALVPLVLGCGLVFAGATGLCGLAMVLTKMPWNRLPKGPETKCPTPSST